MNPKLKIFLRLLVIFIIIAIIIQPYNFFCNITSKCEAISLFSFLPKKEGKEEVKIVFGVKNYVEKLDIKPEIESLMTVWGRRNKVKYIAKNNSGHFMRFRMDFFVFSSNLKDHIKIYNCPCSGQKKLKKDEESELVLEFEIDDVGIKLLQEIAKLQKEDPQEALDASNFQNKENVIGFKVIPF